MRTKLFAAALTMLLAASVHGQSGTRPTSQTSSSASAGPADGASVDAIIAALYESVSHPDGVEPDWPRMRKIFLPVGMLIPPKRPNEDMFTVLDVDGFRERVREGMANLKKEGKTSAFFEKEVARRLDCFGNVCQAFSTYEARRAPSDEKPFRSASTASSSSTTASAGGSPRSSGTPSARTTRSRRSTAKK